MDDIKIKFKKTSRFVDNFIKVIAFLSFLLFLLSFYIHKFKAEEIFKNQIVLCDVVLSQGLTTKNPLENPIHSSLLEAKNVCFNNAERTTEMWGKLAFITLDISVLLPFVYFGSKKVVRDTSEKALKINKLG